MGERTHVDVLSLEDFHGTLAHRLTEAENALSKLNTELQCTPPALGTFADATQKATRYTTLHEEHVDRVDRLRRAVKAAQTATATILRNYKTTEARNHANAADIAAVLGGVDAALKEDVGSDV
jgi:hypothetical protein